MAEILKKEEWPLVSFRLHPDSCKAVAQAMKRLGVTSRPAWLISVIEAALAEQESGQ